MSPPLTVCFALLILAILLALVRLAFGPTLLDRILAFDTVSICAVGMVVLLSILWKTPIYLELILVFSLLGFVGTVAFVFLNRMDEKHRRAAEVPHTANPEP